MYLPNGIFLLVTTVLKEQESLQRRSETVCGSDQPAPLRPFGVILSQLASGRVEFVCDFDKVITSW